MRVVFVLTRSDFVGGSNIHVRDMAAALLAGGHAATVLVGGHGPFLDQLDGLGVPYRSLRWLRPDVHPVRDVRAVLEVRDHLRDLQPDLVSAHSSKAGVAARIAARTLGLPVIFTAHGWAFSPGRGPLRRALYLALELAASPLADRILTVSEFDLELARRFRLASRRRLVAVHNGMPDIEAEFRARPDQDPPRLIMVGRFEPQKNHVGLLAALGELRDRPWTLDLVGDGPLRPRIERCADDLGLADRIRFLGVRTDVAELLSRSQLFLLISHWEGLPRSIIEAMRAGLPVVASDVGGTAEEVEQGVTGYVVPPGSGTELAERLRELIEDPDARARFGAAGRERYESGFTFRRMFDRTMAVYHEVLETRTKRTGSPTAPVGGPAAIPGVDPEANDET